MSKFMNFLKRNSKKIALLTGASAAVVIGITAASAWGPDRRTFTSANPADYITFNSIVDNPDVGDERNFVVVKDAANTNAGGWRDDITVEPGKEYLVRMYIHNNAADNLNLTALNTRVSASIPTTTGKSIPISGFVSADNAQPKQVWDDIKLTSDKNFNLAFVNGSARIYNNGYAAGGSGQALPDSIVTASGAQVGFNGPDGKVPGCFKYSAYVTFKVKPQFQQTPNYTIAKEVRKKGDTTWAKNIKAQPGDEVEWRMQFKNTGETQLNNIIFLDQTPKNTTTVRDSIEIFDANFPNGQKQSNSAIQGEQININLGNYGAKSNAWIYYNSKIDGKDKLPCGATKLVNKVYITPGSLPTIADEASVEVEKDCVEEPKFSCDALEADRLNIKIGEKANFTAKGSASNGATITGYIFKVNGQVVQDSSSNTFAYTGTSEGTFTVSVIVKTDKGNTAESDNCKKQVKVTKEAPKPVYECTGLTATALGNNMFRLTATTRVENATVNKYIFNFGDNTAELSTTESSVDHSYAVPGEYIAKVRVIFNVGNQQKTVESENCKVTITIANNPCPIPGKEHLPKDSPDCKEKPTTPVTTIPSTGAGSAVTGIFGASMTAYGLFAIAEKRRALKK